MDEQEWLAERFETHRTHLQGVAYRMLGSLSEAEDAVQETWFRLSRSDSSDIENLGCEPFSDGWTRRPAGTSQGPGRSNNAAVLPCRYAYRREPTGG